MDDLNYLKHANKRHVYSLQQLAINNSCGFGRASHTCCTYIAYNVYLLCIYGKISF